MTVCVDNSRLFWSLKKVVPVPDASGSRGTRFRVFRGRWSLVTAGSWPELLGHLDRLTRGAWVCRDKKLVRIQAWVTDRARRQSLELGAEPVDFGSAKWHVKFGWYKSEAAAEIALNAARQKIRTEADRVLEEESIPF